MLVTKQRAQSIEDKVPSGVTGTPQTKQGIAIEGAQICYTEISITKTWISPVSGALIIELKGCRY